MKPLCALALLDVLMCHESINDQLHPVLYGGAYEKLGRVHANTGA
jgi:hypothetical protein